ncbi:MAG: valine--tRNA ligase, partial [Microbacteriaceae bacterium]|nr:valine--tRNA ligase [Microbacteriaceae bacterium]
LEIVSTLQWYLVNGARDETLRDALVGRGREIDFHPEYMRVRYENWVGGLTGDWLVSRQRFFGVPIPVWYPVDAQGEPDYDAPILPAPEQLPVDPAAEAPAGYDESQRGRANGFIGEVDVMDTWMTSSLTPQLAGGWERDPELFEMVYPFDVRPQGQDIIRTWLFSTLLRSELEAGALPWKHTTISGFIVDPDRKKMSKSKGNVVTPAGLLDQHGSDAVRYWAASSRLGADAAFDPQRPTQMKIGRRLAIKVLNAAKLALGWDATGAAPDRVTHPLDLAMLAELRGVIEGATRALDEFNHARALETTETFFWTFCDDYLELVKERAYGDDEAARASAVSAVRLALSVLVRLLAPVIPFATEEVWSWWQSGSVHTAAWPAVDELPTGGEPRALELASEALTQLRGAKTAVKVSQRTPMLRATIAVPGAEAELLRGIAGDLVAVGRIEELVLGESDGALEVRDVELGEPPVKA